MKFSVVRETFPGEKRVALVPALVPALRKLGEVLVEQDAGVQAGFADKDYLAQGALSVPDRDAAFRDADVVLTVRCGGALPEDVSREDLRRLRSGQSLIGIANPWDARALLADIAATGVNLFSLELIPRITRAQTMDVLSSMATIAGYRAVIVAAAQSPRLFPLLMTAAGTLSPAKVLVIGVGVAGLQAIATARRLGAVVQAYDVRAAAEEQVRSLGAKFVKLDLPTAEAETASGYARQLDATYYQRQQELLGHVVADSDVVISTAAVPGKPAPRLIGPTAVRRMRPGSVIVDLAADRGGNCELTVPNQTHVEQGVTILGPTNLPADAPFHASQMWAKNVVSLLQHLVKNQTLAVDMQDEITAATLVTQGGRIVHPAFGNEGSIT